MLQQRRISVPSYKVFVDMPQLVRGFNLRDLPMTKAKELLIPRTLNFRHYTCFYRSSVKTILTVITGPRNQHMKRERYSTLVKKEYTATIALLPLLAKQGQLQLPRGLLILLRKKTL